MTYIATVPLHRATGDVARTYADIRHHFGTLPALFQLMSADPRILQEAWRAYPYAMEYGSLGRAERELVALAVSRINACRYGADGATQRLVDMGMPTAQIEALFRADPRTEALHLALISLAENVTRNPLEDHSRSVTTAQDAGLDAQEIREAATVVVWFNLLNRLIDGLGVPHDKTSRRGTIQSLRVSAYGLAARLRRSESLPALQALSEGGAGETAVVILRQLLEFLGPIEGPLPERFVQGIRFNPRQIDRTLVNQILDSGWEEAALFRAAFVLASREALLCWTAIAGQLRDPLAD